MKAKILVIFVCTLMIATAVPAARSLNKQTISTKGVHGILTSTWQNFYQDEKLLASNGAANDEFGYSVALDKNYDLAIIGAPFEGGTGSAYIFNFTTTPEQQEINASNRASGDKFGWSVFISENLGMALIGAPMARNSKGTVYVFTFRTDRTWKQLQEFNASDGAIGDEFGISVSFDGHDIAVIGASGRDSSTGAAYVFLWDGHQFSQTDILIASNGKPGDQFGISVSLSDSLLIGASGEGGHGSAYLFTIRTGGIWKQLQEINASNYDKPESDGALFGWSVSIYVNTALIGAWGFNSQMGTVYIFTYRSADGSWEQLQELNASDHAVNSNFGGSVSLIEDTALIGSAFHNGSTGAAYLFFWDGTSWTQKQMLTASDHAYGDNFGVGVCLNRRMALVGAAFDDDKGTNSGSAYVFLHVGPDLIIHDHSTTTPLIGDNVYEPPIWAYVTQKGSWYFNLNLFNWYLCVIELQNDNPSITLTGYTLNTTLISGTIGSGTLYYNGGSIPIGGSATLGLSIPPGGYLSSRWLILSLTTTNPSTLQIGIHVSSPSESQDSVIFAP